MLPKTTPEQRSRFYEDVENLLTPGFLTHYVSVNGVRLHLRSLGAGDLFMLKARTEGATDYDWRVWTVATSIWMVDGRTVLGHDEAIPFLADYVRHLPKAALDILFSILLGLWVRQGESLDIAEVFCFETNSRYKWKTIGMAGLQNSGVPGAERLGLNAVQRIWTAFNEMEDKRRSEDTAWEGFKLVASSNAPKAITKLDKRDQQRHRDEIAERQRRLDRSYYVKLGVISGDDDDVADANGSMQQFSGPKSVEDLEDEMRRWVTDDQDLHDRVVSDYKNRIRVQQERHRQDHEERRAILQRKRDEMGWEEGEFQPQPLVAMTAEQLQNHLAHRRVGMPGVAFIPAAPDAERITSRYLSGDTAPGNLQVVGGKVVDPKFNPETDIRTLNELIKSRNPAFGSGE